MSLTSSSTTSPLTPQNSPSNDLDNFFDASIEDMINHIPILENPQGANSQSIVQNDNVYSNVSALSTVFDELSCLAQALIEPQASSEAATYNREVRGKLQQMARSEGRLICKFCLTNTRSSAGHKNCLAFFDRLINIMMLYLDNEPHFSIRLTPAYITQWLALNTSLEPSALDEIKAYLTQVFSSFWKDFFKH